MMTPERRIVTRLELREISGVTTPAQSGAVVAIIKSGDRAKSADPVRSPMASKMTPEGEQQIAKMLAAIRGDHTPIAKRQHEENRMSDETHYDRLVKSHAQRNGVSIAKAATKLMADDPDSVAEAYNRDEEEATKRRFAEASRT